MKATIGRGSEADLLRMWRGYQMLRSLPYIDYLNSLVVVILHISGFKFTDSGDEQLVQWLFA